MAKYYYDKYTAVGGPWLEPPVKYSQGGSMHHDEFARLYKTATWVPGSKNWTLSNPWGGVYMSAGMVGYDTRTTSQGLELLIITVTSGSSYAEPVGVIRQEARFANDATPGTYTRGSLVQSNILAENGTYPMNGRHTDGYWYVRGSAYVPPNVAPAAPSSITLSKTDLFVGNKVTVSWSGASDSDGSITSHHPEVSLNGGAYNTLSTITSSLGSGQIDYIIPEATTSISFRVRVRDNGGAYSGYRTSEVYTVRNNKSPVLTLNTVNNTTLYENDSFIVEGTALDSDVGDVLIVYYKLTGGVARGIATKLSEGTAIPYKETLTFKSGKLHRGETAITDALKEGTPYTLEVWAEDNQGGKSDVETRTFFVVPNRPPTLSIDPITDASGMIDSDKITIKGTSADPDGNDVKVQYRINEAAAILIHDGPASAFTFDVQLGKLKDGLNTIVVEAIDTHDFKVSRTIKIPRVTNLTPLAKTVQRYKIYPPAGTAHGVLMWILRDLAQEVTVEISMTNGSEQENYVPLILDTSAPDGTGLTEDFYKLRSDTPAENIVIKLTWTGDKPIMKLTGALTQ